MKKIPGMRNQLDNAKDSQDLRFLFSDEFIKVFISL